MNTGKGNSIFCASLALLFGVLSLRAESFLDVMWKRPVVLREGVTLRAYALDAPRTMKAYVVRVDLTAPGIGFTVTERDPHWGDPIPGVKDPRVVVGTRREKTIDFMKRRCAAGQNVEIAVNASPWRPFPPPKGNVYADPKRWNVSDGVEISHIRRVGKGHLFVVRRDGTAEITASVPLSKTNEVAYAVGGHNLIMTNGVCRYAHDQKNLHPRTAFGLTADRKTLVLLAVDGRQPGYSEGADLADLCDILRREGATDAVNMDGGGSTSLVIRDPASGEPLMLNRHAQNYMREVAVNFGITFKRKEER